MQSSHSRWRFALSLAIAAVWAAAGPAAHADLDVAAERARIAREREVAEQTYARTQANCAVRFIVTSCSDAATKARRETLESLRRQTLALDEAERRGQAARRLQAIDDKRHAHAAQSASHPAESASAPAAEPAASENRRRPVVEPSRLPAARDERAAASERRAGAAAAKARAAERIARLQDAQEHRQQVERRNAAREKSGSKAAPLPQPAGASSAGSPAH